MKNLLRAVIALLLVVLVSIVSISFARTGSIGSAAQGRQITLQTQLTVGLKAFTKADRKFVNNVVLLVKQGKLPRKVVDRTFLWARRRATEKSKSRNLRPMVYFRPGLAQQAKRFGLKL